MQVLSNPYSVYLFVIISPQMDLQDRGIRAMASFHTVPGSTERVEVKFGNYRCAASTNPRTSTLLLLQ